MGRKSVKAYSLVILAMGFSVGLISTQFAAEVGTSAVKPSSFAVGVKSTLSSSNDSIKIEEYWAKTNLQVADLKKLVNNTQCQRDQKSFLACVNSILLPLQKTNLHLQLDGSIRKNSTASTKLDNYNEKQNLSLFTSMFSEGLSARFDFDQLWSTLLTLNPESKHKYLIAAGINGFLSVSVDPHTYISPTDYFRQVSASNERSKYFLGISFEKKNSKVFIRKVFKNSDADQAGLKNNDEVVSINGQNVTDMSISEVSALLKDKSQKTFPFVVKRHTALFVKKIKRSYRVLSQVQSEVIDNGSRIGYIQLSKFAYDICDNVKAEIQRMQSSTLSGLVLDLRDNPGGLLTEASCVAGLFLGEGKKIFSVKYLKEYAEEVALTTSEQLYFGPLVILTNNSSASASELIAGAMQEYNRATVVGEKTFGKGSFQEIDMWNEDAGISFFQTKGFYLLPSGETTQIKGVIPDVVLDDENNVVSEGDLYQFPLHYQADKKSIALHNRMYKKMSHHLNCAVNGSRVYSDDKFIAHAQQILSCEFELASKSDPHTENINL